MKTRQLKRGASKTVIYLKNTELTLINKFENRTIIELWKVFANITTGHYIKLFKKL